jgi:acetyltransferase-like isoleucine patch superfamily enzyme
MSSGHVTNSLPDPILHRPIEHKSVLLYDGCDIGAGSIILMGAIIGKEAQIGAGAVVVDNIPSRKTAVGVPAKILYMGRRRVATES